MSRVTHFEIHAFEPQVPIDFYSTILGWTFKAWIPAVYWLIETGPNDRPGINGGLVKRPVTTNPDSPWVNAYVCAAQVAVLDDALSMSLTRGAVVALPKMAVPGVGWLAYIKDPDGNVMGLMEQDTSAK